jgi:nitrate/TMAO reductase-like tetraheme cytochrome c subunit
VSSRAALARHPLAIAGVLITTVSAVLFIVLAMAVVFEWLDNPYAGLVVFLAVPALFVLGLLLIPLGMWLQARKDRRDPEAVADWSVVDFRKASVRRAAIAIIALTAVNLALLLLGGYGTLHSMESPEFCGQVCHTPMHPQFTSWQSTVHARVSCTECHIGGGVRAFVHYKLVGVRQLYHVAVDQVPKPIPGVADMRPAKEVCGSCHWPGRGFPDSVRVIREFADDETSSETTTVLQMHLGGPGQKTPAGRAIHWHADPRVSVEYVATDRERQTIPWVKVTDERGQVREFVADGATPEQIAGGERRTMDCIDCHNAVGHRISPTPERAVDETIAAGRIDRALPFVRREAVRLLKEEHAAQDDGVRAVGDGLRKFYAAEGRGVDARALEQAADALSALYGRNVFPVMKVTWGVYPDNLGHITSTGCFRCHDGGHAAKDGTTISADCEYCHKQIEVPAPPAVLGETAGAP